MFLTWSVNVKFEESEGDLQLWARRRVRTYLLDKAMGLTLLQEFSECADKLSLLKYLNKHGHPLHKFGSSTPGLLTDEVYLHGDSGVSVKSLLALASLLYWCRTLISAVAPDENPRQLKERLLIDQPRPKQHRQSRRRREQFDRSPRLLYFTMRPSSQDLEMPWLSNFHSYEDIHGNQLDVNLELLANHPEMPELVVPGPAQSQKLSRMFVSSLINQLVSDIPPRLTADFVPCLLASNPWQAMCLALYENASGESIARKCQRPDCGEWISFVKAEGERKKPSNTKWCSVACKQWKHDQKRRGGS